MISIAVLAADAEDLAQHANALVGSGASVDLAGGDGDLAVKVPDQRQQAVQPPAGCSGQFEAGEVLATSITQSPGRSGSDANPADSIEPR